MGDKIKHIQANEANIGVELQELEIAEPRVIPLDQLPRIKHGSDFQSLSIVRGWCSVIREFDHLHWTSDCDVQLIRRKRANIIQYLMRYHTAIMYTFMTECFCEPFKPHIFVPRRALMTINERLLSTVVKVGFTAEEEVEIYENPLLYQKKAIMLTVFVFHYVAVHKELLTQQLNQEVAPYMIRKLLPIVTTHQHILKTAIARRWEVEEEIDGVKIQVVDRKTTAFKPHRPYNFKSAPLSDRMIYENADTKSINKTIVDVAGEYKIVLPYTLPQGSAGLLREALDKVVKEANINEPFYMRHIYASKNSPDQIIIIPRSMVDRRSPRKVPTWQAPTRPAQYPRISTMTKAYNPEHIPDLSVPTADKRLIRSKQKHGPLFDSATNKVYDQLEGADTLSYVNTKTPAVKRRFQKELPKLMDHTDFVEIHNYGSKRGRRRVRIPKTRVKTAPLEFEDVGTTTGEISRWLPEGQIQQLGHVQVSKDQEITRIDDYLDEAPISNYVASPFEYTDQQKVLKVARTKPRKVKIAQKGRQAAELEELLVEELAEQTNEQFSMKRLRGRKILTKPRQLGQQWQHPLENYTERYVYDPITERLEEYFNTFPNDLPIMAEYMAANDPEPANDAYAPQKAKAQKRRNMRRYYAARHKRRLKDEYADHHNEKLRPIDLIALRPKSFKYQVLSQIPSAAPYTEMDEYGLYKNVYIDEVPVKQVAGYDHRESGNRAMLESAQSALGTGDNEAIDSVNVVSGPKVLIHESQKNAAEKSAIVTRETIDPSKPQKVFLDSVPHEQSGRHHELDFTKNTHQEYVVAGTAGDIERVPVHKRIKAKKVMQTMRQSPGTEWTPINEAVQTNEPYYTKKIKAKKIRGPYLKSALKYNPTLEEIAEEHPPDLSLRSPDVEKYIYGGGLLSHERYEMEPEEWTGDAGSYNLMTERIGYKNTKPVRKQVGQQSSRVRKEYVEAYIAEEPFTYTPDITHDMELTQQFIQHADKVETVPLSQIGPSLQPTDLYQPDVTDHLFDGYSISRNVQHLYAENPDQDTASPVNVINESTTPELYKYTKKYIPNDWPAAPIGTQTDINELPDTVTIRAVHRDLPVEEEIYGGWYDSTTNHWIIDTADGNVAIRAADIRLVRHKEVERDLSQHLSRTIYEKRKRLPKKPGLAAVRLDSTSPTRYYDYMFTSPDRVMITPDEHSPHKPRIAIGRTQGRPFTEELRSGADGVHWSPTGIPDQGRIKKIQRVRLMPKRYIGEPQHTADKIEMIEPKYTGPGVPKQRRYQPKVHDCHVTPSGTAMMEKSTQLRRTERRPDVELNRQFVKGQRFFDDPYSMPESAELHKQELTARKPSAVRRYRPRQARTMTTDATSIGREFIPIQQSYRTKLARLDKKIRQPMSYMDHLTQTSVGKELVSEQQLDPYFIPKQTVGQVWPKKMNLLVNPYNKDRGMSEEVNTDNRSSTSATEQSYHVNPAAGESRQRQHRHNVGATWQFETKY